ncbi:hypothetical protein OGAPHI_004655 [Ogataea philodendri]|uniref:Uncharacterized protein n=1 Tax=Ogataea philodendri TaxID=1378263 RepID=A0A9P8P2E5_9ASCO|nr:uncharacterized protein OGAPHI_004655 [Ogataea philodendri]KAH3664303.1 hypothetical protein OGAPHI_004655 [Ogataea philodendri]
MVDKSTRKYPKVDKAFRRGLESFNDWNVSCLPFNSLLMSSGVSKKLAIASAESSSSLKFAMLSSIDCSSVV